jgi:hypothetical protein
MESRRHHKTKPGDLPVDFLKLVKEVFSTNFESGLKALAKIKADPSFEAQGRVFVDEIVLAVSLIHEGQLAATTVYASCDFDPKASSPTIQDLLNICVDAIGSFYGAYLNPKNRERLEQLADESLSALEAAPFQWTPLEVEKRQVFLKVDKANPKLDQMADEWLAKNDPRLEEREAEEQREMEKLFITGPKSKPSGTTH